MTGDRSSREGRLAAATEATQIAGGTVDAVIACAGIAIPKRVTAAVNFFGMTEFLEAMQPALTLSPAPRVALISSIASPSRQHRHSWKQCCLATRL